MPRRLPSSALDTQSQITAVSGSLASPQGTLSGYWKLDQKLTGDLEGNAKTATTWASNVAINGTNVNGGTTPVTIGVNTTSLATSGTYYPTFVPSNTAGNQQASTHASLNYDPNTGFLSATKFVGSGAGLTGVVKSISFNGAAAVDGAVTINQSSYGLGAVGGDSNAGVRLYSSSTTGATYSYITNTAISVQRIGVGLGALDAGETALRAVFNATNPATGQPYGDLSGNGLVDDAITMLQLEAGTTSPTSRSNQLLAAIAASADIGLIVRYGWIGSSLAGDVILKGSGGITTSRTGNTITFNAPAAVAQVQPDWNATTGLGSILNKPTLFDGNYNSLSNKPTIPSVSGTLKEVASWTSVYLGDGLQTYTAGGGPIVTGSGGAGGPLGGWYQTIYYEFDPSYFAGYNAATIAHVHLDYAYPVYWTGFEGGSVMSMSKTYSIVRRQSATGPVLAVGVTIACNQSRNVGADMWPYSITLHFYANQ